MNECLVIHIDEYKKLFTYMVCIILENSKITHYTVYHS